jgi:hypothetical protein
MDILNLINYLKETQNYIEFSFYKNSSEIMDAISKHGIDEVLTITSLKEVKKGTYECLSIWKVEQDVCYSKKIIIDMSSEMIYLTEFIDNSESITAESTSAVSSPAVADTLSDSDIQKEYAEILNLLKSKALDNSKKSLLTKVVAAFFN